MDEEKINLIRLAKSGDKIALEKLIKNIQADIYSMLYYLKKNSNDISDLAQEILVKVSKKIYQLKNLNNFKNWLNQIVVNSYYDSLRKQNKHNKKYYFEKNIEDKELQIPDNKINLQESIIDNEIDLIIKNSINNLPLHYKIPIALRELQGLSYEEISGITKTTIGTVKSRISRARAKIKNEIDKYNKS